MGACFWLRGAVPLRPHGCSLMRHLGPGNRAATYGVDRPAELAAFTSPASGLGASRGGGPGPRTLGWGLAPAARQRALALSALRRGLAASAPRLMVEEFGIGTLVGWALAVITGALSVLPDLRIWWRRPTTLLATVAVGPAGHLVPSHTSAAGTGPRRLPLSQSADTGPGRARPPKGQVAHRLPGDVRDGWHR